MEIKELGHAVLFVKNIERSVHFYRDVLGFHAIERTNPDGSVVPLGRAAMFSSGRTHHELLLIEVGEDGGRILVKGIGRLYHLGFKIGDNDNDLREALARLAEENVTVLGLSDHTVTHSLYILDPDGNELELYIDVPGLDWNDAALVMAPTKALSL